MRRSESVQPATFRKVLVANRGEIARRIFRTLRDLGSATVAVFSDADEAAPHVAEADEAVRLGPAPSARSYLNQAAVLAAAKAVGAEAIHPGYGFLAENADFAERCAEAGVIFIGPSPATLRQMADKAAAKRLAAEVGVPVLEGFPLEGLDPDEVTERARRIGLPLLVKAVAGGGGKGMRVLSSAAELLAELPAALEDASREAMSAFGDGRLMIERFLTAPRHVEVQIFGDAHGRIVHLFERDCSVQRRHQKVFEECPSPAVDATLRARLGEAAAALARAVDYRGAGTVEFLLDESGDFFFLEMNTRLQVEHPVTEMVTGLDLVRWQIEIAQGAPLELEQEQLELQGHSLEARLYAEDPHADFLPVTGTVALWSVPQMPGVRVDSGVEAGSEISVHYDPLLAKVIAHGRTRDEAVRRLHRALEELAVGGLTTNRDFLLSVLETAAFRQGDVDTGFIEQYLPPATRSRRLLPEVLALHAIAATLEQFWERRRSPTALPPSLPSGWRNNRWRAQEQRLLWGETPVCVRYIAHPGDRFTVDVDVDVDVGVGVEVEVGEGPDGAPRAQEVRLVSVGAGQLVVVEVGGIRRRFRVARSRDRLSIHGLGQVSELTLVSRFPRSQAAALAGGCVAPMTGLVVKVLVKEGDLVSAGSPLVVLEAMKMEHRLVAEGDGVIRQVRVVEGQMVDPDEILVVVVPRDATNEEGSDDGKN